jgi:hypothetical protein
MWRLWWKWREVGVRSWCATTLSGGRAFFRHDNNCSVTLMCNIEMPWQYITSLLIACFLNYPLGSPHYVLLSQHAVGEERYFYARSELIVPRPAVLQCLWIHCLDPTFLRKVLALSFYPDKLSSHEIFLDLVCCTWFKAFRDFSLHSCTDVTPISSSTLRQHPSFSFPLYYL